MQCLRTCPAVARVDRESRLHSHLRLRLKHERLSYCLLQNRPAIVHGVQKPEQFATQLPILGRHRTAQQPEGVVVTRVELLETVQDEEVRTCRSQALRAQACLRRIGGEIFSVFHFSFFFGGGGGVNAEGAESERRTSNNVLGSPTMSNRRRHRAISVLRAHPTTTSRATSKWSKNSMTDGRMLSSPFVVPSSPVASYSTTV